MKRIYIVHQSALKRIQWNKNNGTGGGNSSISFKAVFKAKGKRNLYRISTNNYAPFAFPFSCPWFFHLSRGQFLNSSAKMKNAWNYQNFPATSDFVKLCNKNFFKYKKRTSPKSLILLSLQKTEYEVQVAVKSFFLQLLADNSVISSI